MEMLGDEEEDDSKLVINRVVLLNDKPENEDTNEVQVEEIEENVKVENIDSDGKEEKEEGLRQRKPAC